MSRMGPRRRTSRARHARRRPGHCWAAFALNLRVSREVKHEVDRRIVDGRDARDALDGDAAPEPSREPGRARRPSVRRRPWPGRRLRRRSARNARMLRLRPVRSMPWRSHLLRRQGPPGAMHLAGRETRRPLLQRTGGPPRRAAAELPERAGDRRRRSGSVGSFRARGVFDENNTLSPLTFSTRFTTSRSVVKARRNGSRALICSTHGQRDSHTEIDDS